MKKRKFCWWKLFIKLGFALLLIVSLQAHSQTLQAASINGNTIISQKKYEAKPYHTKFPIADTAYVYDSNGNNGRILRSFPFTTWYATATVTVKSNKKRIKYFKVDYDNNQQGYIESKYLVKGKFETLSPNLPDYLFDPVSNFDPDPGLSFVSRDEIDNKLNKQVVGLFPGTHWDKQVQLATAFYDGDGKFNKTYVNNKDRILGKSNADKITMVISNTRYTGKKADLLEFVKKQLTTELAKQGKKLSDFGGYRIGASTYPWNDSNVHVYGKTYVYLVPPEVKLPKLESVTYDPKAPTMAVSNDIVDTKLNDEVAKLFPNTVRDKQVDAAARLYYGDIIDQEEGDDNYSSLTAVKDFLGENNYLKRITELNIHTLGEKTDLSTAEKLSLIKQKLAKAGVKFDKFSGYRIGVYVAPFSADVDAKRNNGMTEILLVPPTVKLPTVSNYTFDVNQQDILK